VDIYALGAILYELLTGQPPFHAENSMQTLLLLRTQEPQPLSRRQPRVPRDLETICLKCLEKQPARRYASAEALADDLQRFLEGEPIHARPVGPAERVLKWTRRNPTATALIGVSTVAVVVLVTQFVWSHFQLRAALARAERRSQLARMAVDDMYVQATEQWLDHEPHNDPLQREFLEKALKVYQELADEAGTDPELRQATGRAHFRMGQIYRQLGRYAEAEQAYQDAITWQQRLSQDHPSNPLYQKELADSHNWLGELYRTTSRFSQATAQYSQALNLQEHLTTDHPHEVAYWEQKARSHYNQGLVHQDTNRLDQAIEALDTAIAILTKLTGVPGRPTSQAELARSYLNRGTILRAKGLPKDAEQNYDQAIQRYARLKDRYPGRPDYRFELALCHNNLGNLLQRVKGRQQDAEAAHARALALLGPLTVSYPGRPRYREELANTHNSMGAIQYATKKWPDAERSWQEALELFSKLVLQAPTVADYRYRTGLVLGNLGLLQRKQGNPAAARKHLDRAVVELQAALKLNSQNARYRQALLLQYRELGEALLQQHDHARAAEVARAFVGASDNLARDGYLAAGVLARCVACVDLDARIAVKDRQALKNKYADQAMTLLRQTVPTSRTLARLQQEHGHFESLRTRGEFQRLLADWRARLASASGKPGH
jgi:tetratricopeptide (TPR) repeat protein